MHSPHDPDHSLRITEDQQPGAHVVRLAGEADLDNVAPLRALLEKAVPAGEPLVLDLSELRFADSTMLNVLLQTYAELGDRLRIAAPSRFVLRLFSLTGLEDVLPIHASVAEATGVAVPPVAGG
ncbi:STAS domain-containing protein [Streptomyces sp. LP05-1]|uniref:Anti-sigma factor antagonist n=1 Tax=Streptomyces pyxinae TaxID=2970734 RepID=A0ABT2CIW5_9ACTN|nr:STAS domain-containing protein [Streptomyces sp. LP05-1]MCS0636646.1 STAS domain-containing protein [Streptomyces sp. LP05-1]